MNTMTNEARTRLSDLINEIYGILKPLVCDANRFAETDLVRTLTMLYTIAGEAPNGNS